MRPITNVSEIISILFIYLLFYQQEFTIKVIPVGVMTLPSLT